MPLLCTKHFLYIIIIYTIYINSLILTTDKRNVLILQISNSRIREVKRLAEKKNTDRELTLYNFKPYYK